MPLDTQHSTHLESLPKIHEASAWRVTWISCLMPLAVLEEKDSVYLEGWVTFKLASGGIFLKEEPLKMKADKWIDWDWMKDTNMFYGIPDTNVCYLYFYY